MKDYRNTSPSRTIEAMLERFPILNQLFDNPTKPQAARPGTCPICGRRYVFRIIHYHDASYTVRECPRCTPKAAA